MSVEPGPQAETRVLRTIVIVFGVATLVFFGLTVGPIMSELDYVNPVWAVVSATVVFGTPPLLAIASPLLQHAALTRLLTAYAIAFTLVVVTFTAAMTVHPMPIGISPWPLGLTALGTVAVALAWRPVPAWIFLVFHSFVITPVRQFADGGASLPIALQDSFFTLTFAAIFTALAIVAMGDARAVDIAAAEARSIATRAAAAAARFREQQRLDALVHDEIMTALLYGSEYSPTLAAAVQRQAERAISELTRLSSAEGAMQPAVPLSEFVSRLRSAVLGLSVAIAFEVHGERTGTVPAEVAAAFAEATTEAVRNSLLHAGVRDEVVSRSVNVTLGAAITVLVVDDGAGFQQRSVPPHRLGIAVSIRGRLATVTGGRAIIDARPGRGTIVALGWGEP